MSMELATGSDRSDYASPDNLWIDRLGGELRTEEEMCAPTMPEPRPITSHIDFLLRAEMEAKRQQAKTRCAELYARYSALRLTKFS